MNRLILMKKFDIINILYQRIIDQKINNYIQEHLTGQNPTQIKLLIENLLKEKFKGEYLKDEIDKLTEQFKTDDKIYTPENIFNLIKYDYNINGFEGIYINENINGLIQYLSDEKLVGTQVQKPAVQKSKKFFEQQRDARLLLISLGVQNLDMTNPEQSQVETVLIPGKPGATLIKNVDPGVKAAAAAFTQSAPTSTTVEKTGNIDKTKNAVDRHEDNIMGIFDLSSKLEIIPNLFRSGLIYRSTKFQVGTNSEKLDVLDLTYNYIIDQYNSSSIYSSKQPLIQNILQPYLPEEKIDSTTKIVTMDFSKSRLVDFKMFYLFANYGTDAGKDELHELKCYQQNLLLLNTSKFIEAIYK
jgi:hypothetical protein